MTGLLATVAGVSIRAFGAAEAEARLGELSAILVDAVAHGGSISCTSVEGQGSEFYFVLPRQ